MTYPSSSSSTSFDVIVIGVGSMGAPACYYLARQGYKVLGIEQFDITHGFGSHAGQSRIIRKAYFEDTGYVSLLQRAYENWRELEQQTGEQVYYKTGLVYFGNPANKIMSGVAQAARLFDIPVTIIDETSAKEQFPQFELPDGFQTILEPDAGFITPEKAIKVYAGQAVRNNAEIHTDEKVLEWKKDGESLIVISGKNTYQCSKLIITAGAWTGKIIPEIQRTIKVTRQVVAWINPKTPELFSLNNFPCWLIADDGKPGCFYGFPVLPGDIFGEPQGLKMAYHHPATGADPDNVNREITEDDKEDLFYVLDKYLPGVFESWEATKTCLYSNTPDENFIIDKLPGFEDHVIIACGFSGHGFKFASVVGEILADLAIKGETKQAIGFLSAKRFL